MDEAVFVLIKTKLCIANARNILPNPTFICSENNYKINITDIVFRHSFKYVYAVNIIFQYSGFAIISLKATYI